MLLRRGIGRVRVDEPRVFASTDDCFVRPGSNLITTPEVLAEEAALLATVKAGQGGYEELGCGGEWKFLSPFVAGNEEQTNGVYREIVILQRIFRSASRRETFGKHSKGGRRDGGLKMDWTKPPPTAWPMCIECRLDLG